MSQQPEQEEVPANVVARGRVAKVKPTATKAISVAKTKVITDKPVKAFGVSREGRLVLPSGMLSVKLVKHGLPFNVVQKLARHMNVPDTNVLAKIGVTGGTVDRRRKAEILKPDESDRFYRLARVTEMAERVIEDPAKAREWLKTKNRALGGVTPFSLLDTEPGVELVEDVLNRIEYGVYG